jgi:FixJ family two-component response regulator
VDHNRRNRGLVALVEDDHSVSRAISRLLSRAGFETRTFERGEALLLDDMAREYRCLIFDFESPGRSALQLYRTLQMSGVRAPLVVVTAHNDAESRAEAAELGAVAYFLKPFSTTAFLNAVIVATAGRQDP